MSNHSGSYMLNEVLLLLEKEGIFRTLGPQRSRRIVREIVERACDQDDCNSGEILESIGTRLGICYLCLKAATNLENGLCKTCKGPEV